MSNRAGNPATKERILDSAEELFAEQGFAASSLRGITRAADANLASVNYHFGSKEALLEAVLARRLEPLNRRRLERLDRYERESGAGGPTLESIVEAFVGPAMHMSRDLGARGQVFVRLMGQVAHQTSAQVRTLFTGQFREIVQRFPEALARALPELDEREVLWRFFFMVGAMAHPMACSEAVHQISDGRCDIHDCEEAMIERLVTFVAAGMRAPAPRPTGKAR